MVSPTLGPELIICMYVSGGTEEYDVRNILVNVDNFIKFSTFHCLVRNHQKRLGFGNNEELLQFCIAPFRNDFINKCQLQTQLTNNSHRYW